MNPMTFFDNLGHLAETPNGVPQLRALILQLAVQGKLVPQDPHDEPADELLASIVGKLRDASQGKRKRSGLDLDGEPASPHAPPYELPTNWRWARFDQVARIASNLVQPHAFADFPHIAPDNIEKGTGRLLPYRTVREDDVRSGNHHFFAGQIIYSKIRPNLAKAVIADFEGLCSADMYPIDAYIDPGYLLRYTLSATFLSMAVRNDTRVAMPKINQEELSRILVPVPPLAEQRRIVAKVDELMKLCDELEGRVQRQREARERLSAAALDRLLTAREPAEFATYWQRLCDHFDLLYDAPETLAQLRQAILQLAVQGKLVPQDPDDEPAHVLRHRITTAKSRWLEAGSKTIVAETEITEHSDQLFPTPSGWTWVRIADVFDVSGGITKNPTRAPVRNHFPYLRVANVQRGRLDLSEMERFELLEGELDRWRLELGDLLVVEGNGSAQEIGRCAMWSGEIPDCVHQNHIIRCRPIVAPREPLHAAVPKLSDRNQRDDQASDHD